MPNPEDYTVAWVTASDEGCKAAKCMLDDVHDVPKHISSANGGVHGLGRIGRHNIIIATTTHKSGTLPVAHVVRRLIHTFPYVRVGILVGVGGGAPSQAHDIRLGDVIVGSALIQSDFAKADQGGSESTPPASLQAVINRLRSGEEGHHINETISQLRKQPRSRNMPKRPGQKSDRLFHSQVAHPENEKNCEAVCTGNPQNMVSRPERASNDVPMVHHGRIASISHSMSDAILRDKIADKNNIICFETEAAGLMAHFPCVVIRGVCDYADSHGDSYSWREYAVATAAAYAKNLLLELRTSAIEGEKRIGDVFVEAKDILSVKSPKLTHVQKPKRFFKQGRVFATVWVEPYLERHGGSQSNFSHPKDQAFSELRRFIVVRQTYHASWCIPIHTYGGQGVHKQDIRIEDHAKVYRSGDEPPPGMENIPLKDPLPIVMEGSGDDERLHPASLVNFGKIYTVEYGARVMNIGFVHRSHGPRLELNWKAPITNESNRTNTETRDKEQELAKTKMETNQPKSNSEQVVQKGGQGQASGKKVPMQGKEVSTRLHSTAKNLESETTDINEQTTSEQDSIMKDDQLSRYQAKAALHTETILPDPEPEYGESNESIDISSRREPHGLYQPESLISKTWVCPFYRLDPGRYSICNKSKIRELRHVLQHLERRHTLPSHHYYCPKCWLSHNQVKEFEDHVRECHRKLPREHFYQQEMQRLVLEIKVPEQKLRDKLKCSLPSQLDFDELQWHYIWQSHFSDEADVSPYAKNLISDVLDFLRDQNKKLSQREGSSSQPGSVTVLDLEYDPPSQSWFPHPEDPDVSVGQDTKTRSGWTELMETAWSPSGQSPSSLQYSQGITQQYDNHRKRSQDDRMDFAPEVDAMATKRLEEFRRDLLEFSYARAQVWMKWRRYCVLPGDKRPKTAVLCDKQTTTKEEGSASCDQEENSDEVLVYHLSHYHLACPFYAFDPEHHRQCLLQHDFLSMEDVTQHVEEHHPKPPYCPICGEKFLRTAQRDIHVRAESCSAPFPSNIEEIDAEVNMQVSQPEGLGTTAEAIQWQLEYEKALPGNLTYRTPYLEGPMEVAVSKIRDYWSKYSQKCISDYLASCCRDDQDEIDNMGIDLPNVILGDLINRVVRDFANNRQIVEDQMEQT